MKQPKPKRQGPGRPPLSDVEQTIKVLVPMTVSQRAKFKRLGGSEWVRAAIDGKTEPKPVYAILAGMTDEERLKAISDICPNCGRLKSAGPDYCTRDD